MISSGGQNPKSFRIDETRSRTSTCGACKGVACIKNKKDDNNKQEME
jgi:hypothetical protein